MSYIEDKLTGRKIKISCITVFDEESDLRDSTSLAEFNSIKDLVLRYNDYEPKDPLIIDKKIRKALRAWAEYCATEKVLYTVRPNESLCCFTDMGEHDFAIEFVGWIPSLKEDEVYTINELCGEE